MRSRVFLATAAGMLALASAMVSSATAEAKPAVKPNAMSGYVSTVDGTFTEYNSTGKPVSFGTISAGEYDVVFQGLGVIAAKGGNFQVSAVEAQDTCAVEGWKQAGSDLVVFVNCYDYSGGVANVAFDLTVTRATAVRSGVLDYALVGNFAKPHRLSGKFLFNSTHGRSTVDRLGTGRYLVSFGGRARVTNTGTVKVSAEAAGAGDCQVVKWHGKATGTSVYVDCFAPDGTRQDRDFLVVYARGNNILGRYGLTSANAVAGKPRTPVYTASPQYDSAKGASVTALTLNKGQYETLFAGSEGPSGTSNGGDVQVSAMGSSYAHCYAQEWAQGYLPHADISCVSNAAKPLFASYVIQWLAG
jgi:hypothetical protein